MATAPAASPRKCCSAMLEDLQPSDRLRPMSTLDIDEVLTWRNHPDVRRHMFTRQEIERSEHLAWFAKASADNARRLLIYERSGIPAGFVSLSIEGQGRLVDWGFYLSPWAPKGSGRSMGRLSLDHAFQSLGAHKVFGQVLADNSRSIAFHESLGFSREGTLQDHFFDGEQFIAVLCFGLLKPQWQQGSRA